LKTNKLHCKGKKKQEHRKRNKQTGWNSEMGFQQKRAERGSKDRREHRRSPNKMIEEEEKKEEEAYIPSFPRFNCKP
jgi:hypothetical protein